MPLYEFEYIDGEGVAHRFDEFYPVNHDFSTVKSPCGNFPAKKCVPSGISLAEGLTANQKASGTTKKRVEMGKFMNEQKRIRKSTYAPGTREHDSNEIWIGNEGKDGVTQMPVNPTIKE